MNPKNNLGYLLHKIGAMLEKQSDEVLFEEFGLGYSQFKLLMVLQSSNGIQQKDIAGHLGQTEASISRQIGLLKLAGFVSVAKTDEDRKKNIIGLTLKGSQVAEEAMNTLQARYAPLFGTLSSAEQASLASTLGKLYDELNIDCNNKITGDK
jgi:DNA-binding MarR family transcriptional regulator